MTYTVKVSTEVYRQAVVLVEGIVEREMARLREKGFPLPAGTAVRVRYTDGTRNPPYGEYVGVGEQVLAEVVEAPSEIVLYAKPLVRDFGVGRRLAREVRITLLHELAHSLGADEEWVEGQGLG